MKKVFLLFAFIPFLLLADCSAQEQSKSQTRSESAAPKKITPAQAKAMMDNGSPYILVDVRTEAEYRDKRIDGAILIPDYEIAASAADKLPDKNAVIIVYCRSGARSSRACQVLAGMGYTNIYDLGGIMSWPYATVSN